MTHLKPQRAEAGSPDLIYDTKQGQKVTLQGKPDTYRRGHIWVRPLEGGSGWLANCNDLSPRQRDGQ